jgi:uroporphyrinogen decarboxylase
MENAMAMTSKERVTAQIEHQETDRIPYTLDVEGDVPEALDAYYGSAAWRSSLRSAIVRLPQLGAGLMAEDTSEKFFTDIYGTVWQMDVRPYHHEEPALKEPTLANFRWPTMDEVFDPDWEERALGVIEANPDRFVVGILGYGLFERTWTLRGFESILSDCILEEDFYDELVAKVAEHQMAMVERILELPVDGIMFSDDWGYQRGVLIGAERWRRFLKPRLAEMYQQVHEAGRYTLSHCCGSIAEILPDLIEIGLDVIESVQPEAVAMNPYALKRRFGEQITFWGGLGSQSTIQIGPPEAIKAEVEKLRQEMGAGGGYILAPAKSLQPGTPVENAAAVVEAFLAEGDGG